MSVLGTGKPVLFTHSVTLQEDIKMKFKIQEKHGKQCTDLN